LIGLHYYLPGILCHNLCHFCKKIKWLLE